MSAMPSESEIKKAIEALKSQPARFQVIAECIMKIKFGGVYEDLIPQGRNAALQTTIGYPDAYATDESGNRYLVEATVGNWRTHIENEDIPGITRIGGANVAQFTLFCTSNSELLIKQDRKDRKIEKKSVDDYKADLAALGVPSAGIRFFFLDQIVTELRRPVYARVLFDLGLDIDIAPFCHITKRLFDPATGPIRSEFEAGEVVADDLIASMRRMLRPGARMLVEGGSGLGKTTLATAFAFDWLEREQDAYYLDLAAFDDPAAMAHLVAQRIKQYGCRGHLFVLDNCHRLAPDQLSLLLDVHVEPGDRPTILALSRNLAEHTAQALCSKHGLKRLQLSLRAEDLRAVYRLLARRCAQSDSYTLPGEADVQHWLSLHADLVTFSLAIQGATVSLQAGLVPRLTRNDAINYLRTRYLRNLPPDELRMLATIALCARFDVPASRASLGDQTLPSLLLERGLVFQRIAKNSMPRYGLVHVKIGALLLACLNVDEEVVWADIIRRDPFQACFIAQRLLYGDSEAAPTQAQSTTMAKDILERVGANAWRFSALFSPGYSGVIASLYRDVGLEATFRASLSREISRYIAEEDNFLLGLPSFLAFTKAAGFDAEAAQVWDDLRQASDGRRLEVAACLAPAPTVHNVLILASERDPLTFKAITEAFASKTVATAIANKFSSFEPKLAEQVLDDFAQWTPALHHAILEELRKGTRLKALRKSLEGARSSASVRYWLPRRGLLRLISDEPPLILPAQWLYERGTVVLDLLLGELAHLRPDYEAQIQDLIARWTEQPFNALSDPGAAAAQLRLMLCMADSTRAPAVIARLRKTREEVLATCMNMQAPFELGMLLLGAMPMFGAEKPLLSLKNTILDICRARIERATAVGVAKPRSAYNLASHIVVARLAGAEDTAPWMQLALATLGATVAHQAAPPREITNDARMGPVERSYRQRVAAFLASMAKDLP